MRDSSKIAFHSTIQDDDDVCDHNQERSMSDYNDDEPPFTFQKTSTSTIETSVESPSPEENDHDTGAHKQQHHHIDEMDHGRCHHTWKAFVFIVLVLGGIVGAWVIVFYQPSSVEPNNNASLPSNNVGNDDESTPSSSVLYDLPTAEECTAISQGEMVPGQRSMLVEFLDVEVDVSFFEGVASIGTLLPSLETTLKERLAPALSGCSMMQINEDSTNNNRNLRASRQLWNDQQRQQYAVIANTFLELQDRLGMSCSDQSPQPCRRVSLSLQVFLKNDLNDSSLRQMILNLGQSPSSLLEILNLKAPYTAISFVDVTPGTPMELTWNPTMAPTKAP